MTRKTAAYIASAVCFAFSSAALAADSGNAVHDGYLTTKVKAELAADSDLKSRHISVKTKDGVVALTGRVDSSAQKDKAEHDARGIDGVVDVINSLKVKQ